MIINKIHALLESSNSNEISISINDEELDEFLDTLTFLGPNITWSFIADKLYVKKDYALLTPS